MRSRDSRDLDGGAADLVGAPGPVLVLTGAGISAESGVPTFRGAGGLWRSYRPEQLATPEAFMRDPALVWEWYRWRRELVGKCAPNAAHLALARFALARGDVTIATQNVDGLHAAAAREAAGDGDASAALPIELHGALFRDRCTRCDWSVDARDGAVRPSGDELPHCPRCGALARPGVVWFGESLDVVVLERVFEAAAVARTCLVVGTSGLVHPAASLPLAVLQGGGAVIEVNPEPTPLTPRATRSIRGTAVEVVPGLVVLEESQLGSLRRHSEPSTEPVDDH